MAKKKQKLKLYSNGKPLTKIKIDYIKMIAEDSGKKINTDKQLKSFFDKHKETFDKKFKYQVQTKPKSSTQVFDDLDTANRYGKKFYIKKGNKLKEVSANDLKFNISLTELNLNSLFESTGTEFSYEIDFNNNIIMRFPDIEKEDEEFYQSESMEVVVDHFSEDYGINIYVSEPKNKDQKELHKQYREEYETKIKGRIDKYKPMAKQSRKKANKVGNRRNKNKGTN